MSTSTDKANVVDIDRPEVVVDTASVHIPAPAAEMVNQQVETSGILYVVPDGFYIPNTTDQPPGWLINIISLVVRQYVGDNTELESIGEQVRELLQQLEEMKEVYEQQQQIEDAVAAQVNALLTPLQNTVAGLTQRLLEIEQGTVSLSDVHTAVQQNLDVVHEKIDLVEHRANLRLTSLESRIGTTEESSSDTFTGYLAVESEGIGTDFYNDDRMDITNEVIHVYSNRDIVLQIGDLSIPTMSYDDFEPEDDDDDDDP